MSADVLLQLGFFPEVGGRICTSHRKTLHSAKHKKNAKKIENPLCGSTSCAVSLRRAADRMTGLGQSLRDPQSLMIGGKLWGNIPGSDCGRVCRSGAEVSSTRRRSPWVNLRWSLRVGAWNVQSPREDDHQSLLSSEFKHFTSVLQHSLRFGDRIAATFGGWLHLLLVWSL